MHSPKRNHPLLSQAKAEQKRRQSARTRQQSGRALNPKASDLKKTTVHFLHDIPIASTMIILLLDLPLEPASQPPRTPCGHDSSLFSRGSGSHPGGVGQPAGRPLQLAFFLPKQRCPTAFAVGRHGGEMWACAGGEREEGRGRPPESYFTCRIGVCFLPLFPLPFFSF